MTKNAELLIENGWYRFAGGWWHKDIGREPAFGKAATQHKAIEYLYNPEDLRS